MARKSVEQNIAYDDIRRCYYVSMDRGRGEDGRRARTYRTYPTLTQARRALRAFQLERQEERQGLDAGYTLADWLEIWMAQVILPNRAETTVYGYRLIMANHLLPALGEVPLQQLSPRHLQEDYAMLQAEKNLCPNTVRRHHDLIACALHLAVRQDLLPRSPTDRVEPPRPRPREATFYSPQDLRRLYAATEGTWLELIVKLAGSCGLRREEALGLKWTDLGADRLVYLEIRAENGPAYSHAYFEEPVVPQEDGSVPVGSWIELHDQTSCQGWQCQGPWSRQGRIQGGESYDDQWYSWEETGEAVNNQITASTLTMHLVSEEIQETLIYRDGVLQDVLVNGESSPWMLQMAEDSEGPQPYSFERARW